MKIELNQDLEVEHSGLEVTAMSFDMTKTAKLFHMLSSTLYSDKIGSIIRELSSNAYDSHLEAGKLDVPFELSSPSFENPSFSIRDYGVGLTREEAEKTILFYLGSTKDSSDDFIGGWGIGSKSPFAYAMNYEVIVFKDGQFAQFACWKNESGIPDKALVDSGSTEEPNGVRMNVPVESIDIHGFNRALEKYLDWTNYNVILDGNKKPREPVVTKDFDNFKIKVYRNGTGERNLVYGGFRYPIDHCINDRWDYASDWSNLNRKLRTNYDIAFVVDEPNLVSFNMNREVLEQTNKSILFVREMIRQTSEIANVRFEAIADSRKKWRDISSQTSNLVEMQKIIDGINDELSTQEDKDLNKIFLDEDIDLRYTFQKYVKIITYRGVNSAHSLNIQLIPIEDQIEIVWSTRARPSVSDRGSFWKKNCSSSKKYLFFKAKSKEECLKEIAQYADFDGFDFEKLVFHELKNTVVPKSTINRKPNSTPVVYCTKRKKRVSYSESSKYVDYDGNLSEIETYFNSSFDDKYVFISPSDKTRENVDVMTYEEFHELAMEWFEKICDEYIPTKLITKIEGFIVDNNNYYYLSKNQSKFVELSKRMSNYPHYLKNHFYRRHGNLNKFERLVAKHRNKEMIAQLKKDFNELKNKIQECRNISQIVDIVELRKNNHPLANLIKDYLESNNFGEIFNV